MLGGTRDKWSRWLATKGLFTSLQIVCDKSHTHKPWGFTAPSLTTGWNFATAEEAEYPAILCQRVAQLVHDKVVQNGAVPIPGELQPWGLTDMQLRHLSRAATGKLPRGRTLPQLVSEFERIEERSTYVEAKNTRLLRQYNKGLQDATNKAQQVFIVGVFREPEDFLKQAVECKHPIDILQNVDDLTKTALFNILTLGPEALTNKRQNFMNNLELRAKELESKEHQLHESMPDHVKKIMFGKRLLLLQELALAAGSKDTGLHKLLTEGTHLTGVTTSSGELFKRVIPAQVTEQELRKQAQWQRVAEIGSFKLSDNDLKVRAQTQDEVEAGWIVGPFSSEQLDEKFGTWVSHRRFGLEQHGKTRIIDDCRQGGINDCLCTVEKLDLMDVDRILELTKVILAAEGTGGVVLITLSDGTRLQGKCQPSWDRSEGIGINFLGRLLDLKSAYKQMAVHSESLWASNVHLASAEGGGKDFYTSHALLFGATASVYAFNRLARVIWRCFSFHLDLLTTQFYDDFPMLEPEQTSTTARSFSTQLLDLLGINWSAGDKDKPFSSVFEPLGVCIDLTGMATKGVVVISNKLSRINAICADIDTALLKDILSPPIASEMHGKLQFSQAQVFGRAALPAVREVSHRSHQPGNAFALTPRLRKALEYLKAFLRSAPPRTVSACDQVTNLIIFSDGAFENGSATWGFFIFDAATSEAIVSGGSVPDALIKHWLTTVGEQIITQVELFAVLAARIHLADTCRSRKTVYYIDNDAARFSLIRGLSDSDASLSIVYLFFELEGQNASYLWFARVASHSNIADAPSRGNVQDAVRDFNARLVPFTLCKLFLNRLLQFRAVSAFEP